MTSSEPHMTDPVSGTSQGSIASPGFEGGAKTTAPKKKAIVVYEGDERWQPPSGPAFAGNQSDGEPHDQNDEASTGSETESPADHGDLLADYSSDSEVSSRSTCYAVNSSGKKTR